MDNTAPPTPTPAPNAPPQSFHTAVPLRADSKTTVGYPPYVNQLYGGSGIATLGCSGKTGGFQSLYEIIAEQPLVEGVTRGVGQVRGRCGWACSAGHGHMAAWRHGV